MANSKKRIRKLVIVVLLLLVSFVGIIDTCNIAIRSVKDARQDQIVDARKRDFESIWGSLQVYLNQSKEQTKEIATSIETEIKHSFDLNDLEQGLDEDDPEYNQAVYEIIRSHIEGVHFGGLENNRNSMIVLEGYDTIVEDFLVDPDSRSDDKKDIVTNGQSLLDYKDTTYNIKLFSSAMQKIRNHTTGVIAIEPYDYTRNPDHKLISDMSYANLEKVYVNEGMDGLKNYQFLVPMYITDTGDIFGQQDIEHGVRQDTHKFIVIQTFNLYDQLTSLKPDIGDDDYLARLNARYDEMLNMLYILGTVAVMMITIIVIYSFSLYNMLLDDKHDFFGLTKEVEDKNT